VAAVAPPSFTSADVWVVKSAGTSVACLDDFTLNETYGTIVFDSSDSGTAASPVVIGSYGTGNATISAGDGFGLWAANVSGFTVQDLNFVGTWNATSGTGSNVAMGVVVANTQPGNTKLDTIKIDDVDASGFKWAGISVEGDNGKSGFTNVR